MHIKHTYSDAWCCLEGRNQTWPLKSVILTQTFWKKWRFQPLYYLKPAGALLVKLVDLTEFYHWLHTRRLLCLQDAPQINFKESSRLLLATAETCGQWTDRKTNYSRPPRKHVFGWMCGFLVFCWMLIAFQCEVSGCFSLVLRMKPKPALFCSNMTNLGGRWDERVIEWEVIELLTWL